MPLIATRGAASAQGFGEFAQTTAPVYIEDVFSTWLYTGTGSARTITNGIDLSTKGGLVWTKNRNGAQSNYLVDTVTGAQKELISNSTAAQANNSGGITSFSSSGYSTGTDGGYNGNADTYVSWTFREQAKFFDIVTYTGNGATNRAISHNLGSTPGCIMIKCTSSGLSTASWSVWHQDIGTNQFLTLNTAAAAATDNTQFGGSPTSTTFTVAGGGAQIRTNQNGETYVAYLFAHDAGGFGLTGSDNVISCGSFTTDGSGNATVSLGYEPQWMITKASTQTENWYINDVMRGYYAPSQGAISGLSANTSNAESGTRAQYINATGFTVVGGLSASQTYIYIAIRRGPMKTPTTATSVFVPSTASGVIQTGFTVDSMWGAVRGGTTTMPYTYDRLRGGTPYLITSSTAAEATGSSIGFDTNNGVTISFPSDYVNWFFQRSPGFFDVVCWTGTGTANRAVQHNLTVAPELLICKSRTVAGTFWRVLWTGSLANSLNLNGTSSWSDLAGNAPYFFGNGTTSGSATAPTATNFYVANELNQNGQSIVAYLFASLSGVSKVGSYTGTGTTLQVNCGFTNGSRFVLIKRTDSTGDWYVWDSARGIVAGNDPYLLMNSNAAQVTNTDYVDTYSAGFEISSTAPAAINANGGTFIFLAIA